MKPQTLSILAVVLGLLLLLVYFQSRPVGDRGGEPDVVSLVQGAQKSFDEITLKPKGKSARLKLQNAHWRVDLNGELVETDEAVVDGLAKRLKDLSTSEMVSEGKNLDTYGLDGENRVEVVLKKNGREAARLWVGNPGPGYRGNFVKFGNREGVYLVRELLRPELDRDGLSFRQNRLFGSLGWEAVTSINLKSASGSVALKKEKDKWLLMGLGEGQAADPEAVQTFLGQSLNLRSMEDPTPEDWVKMLSGSVQATLVLGREVGAPVQAQIYGERPGFAGRVAVKTDALPRPAAIYTPQAALFNKGPKDFLKSEKKTEAPPSGAVLQPDAPTGAPVGGPGTRPANAPGGAGE